MNDPIRKLANELAMTKEMKEVESMSGMKWKISDDGYGHLLYKATRRLGQFYQGDKSLETSKYWKVFVSIPNDHWLVVKTKAVAMTLLPKSSSREGNVVSWDYMLSDPGTASIMRNVRDEIRCLKQYDAKYRGVVFNVKGS
ncbi:MAG: hypothetical protein D4S01_06300 [Dehalococcoidia bacterium]|nr:MAG: hypothetical protein D4S01_06300 [Dehalococcoidia bacterium]